MRKGRRGLQRATRGNAPKADAGQALQGPAHLFNLIKDAAVERLEIFVAAVAGKPGLCVPLVDGAVHQRLEARDAHRHGVARGKKAGNLPPSQLTPRPRSDIISPFVSRFQLCIQERVSICKRPFGAPRLAVLCVNVQTVAGRGGRGVLCQGNVL